MSQETAIPDADRTRQDNFLKGVFGRLEGEAEADKALSMAEHAANAKAAKLLAAQECPTYLIEWGRQHGIPTFAEVTWQAGFLAGMRASELREGEIK
jgi:hypothetical protein